MEKRFNLWEDKTKAKSARRWRVRVPADLSESGKIERLFFPTKLEAQGFIRSQIARLQDQGTGGPVLTPGQREIAFKAFTRLQSEAAEEGDAALLTAVAAYLEGRDRRSRSKPFIEAWGLWRDSTLSKTREGNPTSDKYRRQITYALPRFEPLHGKLVCEITPEDVDVTLRAAVDPEAKSARNGLMRVLRACLKWCAEYGWLDKVPVQAKRHGVDTGKRQPHPLSPTQAKALLAACAAIDPELLGYYAIALFTGIRPEDELAELLWSDVFAGNGKAIHIRDAISKTGRDRYVPINATLQAWLDYINPPQFGPVVPLQPTRDSTRIQKLEWRVAWIGKRRRAVAKAAGIDPWPQDATRHSFASYWMAQHGDEDRCRDIMGHASRDVLRKHYRKHVKAAEATAYWALTPDVVLGAPRLEVVK